MNVADLTVRIHACFRKSKLQKERDSDMDNPEPKAPQEGLDEETEHIHGAIIDEELFKRQENAQKEENIKILLFLMLLCLHLHSSAPSEGD